MNFENIFIFYAKTHEENRQHSKELGLYRNLLLDLLGLVLCSMGISVGTG